MSVAATDLFIALTPERVLAAVEAGGLRTTALCYPLNSFENRVYEVELADRSRVVAKFYRPGRWSAEQIREEHEFLFDAEAAEIPVCPALRFADGSTVREIEGILYALFERKGGRAPDELDDAAAERLGMLVGRLHAVAAGREAPHRQRLDGDTFVRRELAWLEEGNLVPAGLWPRYAAAASEIADAYDRLAAGAPTHRVHGDLHLGNVLLRDGVLRLLDFDDMVTGPAVQDLWLALPSRDADTLRRRELLLEGYERFRAFPRSTLLLVEPLRGMRIVRYSAWLGRRWHDPIFPRTWPHFGTADYWQGETAALEEIVRLVRAAESPGAPRPEAEVLTNKDLFWDWEER
jgi:Ser/Thr protein kinase RdoA (MazF antagonist)